MQIELNTNRLANIVKKVGKGLIHNKFLPYTGYIMISGKGTNMSFAVNDGSNAYIYTLNREEPFELDFSVCVNGERLLQLMTKMTTNKTRIIIEDKTVVIQGNGKYTFTQEEGKVPIVSFEDLTGGIEHGAIKLPAIDLFNKAEGGLSKLVVNPTLMGYYVDNNVILTTNGVKLSSITTESTTATTFYITTRMMDLLRTCEGEDLYIFNSDGINVVKTSTKLIYGPEQPGHTDFPAEKLKELLTVANPNSFTVAADAVLEAIDRLQVFDEGTVYLSINTGAVKFELDNKKRTEEILCSYEDEDMKYKAQFRVSALKELLSRHKGAINFHFVDSESPIKITSSGLVQILATVV